MDNYYNELLVKIENEMQKGAYEKAKLVVEEELRMPYIPKEIEAKLIAFYNECKHQLNDASKEVTYVLEDVTQLLKGNLEEQFMAVELLRNSNIRSELDVVESYLKANPHYLIRSYLIDILMEQQVQEEIKINYEGYEVTFIPISIKKPMEAKGIQIALQTLRMWFENDNPSFLGQCIDTLIKEAYLRLPFSIEEDEGEIIAQAVTHYVFEAYDEEEAFLRFLEDKKLAFLPQYALLLNKHEF